MLKKTVFLILALSCLVLACNAAVAVDLDYSAYTDAELAEIINAAQAELQSRFAAAKPTDAGQFVYASNGQEIRINAYTGTDANVVIPTEIDGLPVTQFQKGAFKGNSTLQSVVIPDTVTVIEGNVFEDCMVLASVVFPKGLTTIKDMAFNNTLTGVINLPASLVEVGGVCFDNQSGGGITGLVINSDLVESNPYSSSFMTLKKLQFLFIREGCNPVFREGSFEKSGQLEIVIIPASVTSLPNHMFEDSNLVKIITPAGSYAESWAREHFLPVDTENYMSYVAEYNALYPIP